MLLGPLQALLQLFCCYFPWNNLYLNNAVKTLLLAQHSHAEITVFSILKEDLQKYGKINEIKKKTALAWDCHAGTQITEQVGTGVEEQKMLNVYQEHANF